MSVWWFELGKNKRCLGVVQRNRRALSSTTVTGRAVTGRPCAPSVGGSFQLCPQAPGTTAAWERLLACVARADVLEELPASGGARTESGCSPGLVGGFVLKSRGPATAENSTCLRRGFWKPRWVRNMYCS